MRPWRRLTVGALLVASLAVSGCTTVGYYAQAVGGHLDLMLRERDARAVIAAPGTATDLRRRLELALELRAFAERELDLPAGGSYLGYVDVGRPWVTRTVVATPELAVEPLTWCFPVVGCVAYRGYFDDADARAFADALAGRGLDVHVGSASAYSTLGWLPDPLLSTMVELPEHRLAGVLFHELAHRRLYAPDDSAFNEAYATTVERAGVRRWLAAQRGEAAVARYEARLRLGDAFLALLEETRERLRKVYASERDDGDKRTAKWALLDGLPARAAALVGEGDGPNPFAAWFDEPVNNARLALVSTYHGHLPALERLLARVGGDISAFHRECAALAALDAGERGRRLAALGPGGDQARSRHSGSAISPSASSGG
ncbi:MAG: aminopeptidase [Ectothiorhodospiraceae bacterium]|nr:aminopeptidase [Ectothiorhodospiraceae bacterium]